MVNIKGFIAAGLVCVALITVFLGLFTNGWQSGEIDIFDKVDMSYGLRELVADDEDASYSETADAFEALGSSDENVDYWNDLDAAGLIV